MKRTIIITVGFPFGNSEPFLIEESRYHQNAIIVSTYMGDIKKVTSNLPEDAMVDVWHPDTGFFKDSKLSRTIATIGAVFTADFWRELCAQDIKPIRLSKIKYLLSFISKAHKIAEYVDAQIQKNNMEKDEFVFYSYWMNQLALAGVMLARKYNGIAISRCHGYDLYRRGKNGYVAMQRYLLDRLNHIYPISEDGKALLCGLSAEAEKKITVSRLGTANDSANPEKNPEDDEFTIVSCSNLVKLKRVELINEALKEIGDFRIHWVHFGDGPLMQELLKAVESNSERHRIEFVGRKKNAEVLQYYSDHHVDLFLNVSSSEGIPVSVMEALSFGIPCAVTNVGGEKEIIQDGYNGFLMNENASPSDIAAQIRMIHSMNHIQIAELRNNAGYFWKNHYCGKTNYTEFIRGLQNNENEKEKS